MATNKFFTWTKGDRKHASASYMPIPAECITIRGLEYSRNAKGSSKANRKPLPLDFGRPVGAHSSESSRTYDSIALQDAAVQSATSLMAVMSDMLKSPQLNAHLLSTQQHSSCLQPLYGRPRSRTAPSTPMFEAPAMEPVELPGSTPSWHRPNRQSVDIKTTRVDKISDQATIEHSIERPHSSPQECTNEVPIYLREAADSSSRSVTDLHTPDDVTPRRARHSSHLPPGTLPAAAKHETNEDDRSIETTTSGRPSLEVQPIRHRTSSRISESLISSRNASSQDIFQSDHDLPQHRPAATTPQIGTASGSMKAMMERISAMRSAHESHLLSLKDSHQRELTSHRAYIALLEKYNENVGSASEDDRPHLALDASKMSGAGDSKSNEYGGVRVSVQSFETSLASEKRTSSEAFSEVEGLKRKLSLSLKAQAQLGAIRRERDQLKDASDQSDKRIVQLKDIIQKFKDKDKACKATIGTLEAALESANMARTDVLEGFYEACEQVRRLSDWQKIMARERKDLRCTRDEARSDPNSQGSKREVLNEPEGSLADNNTLGQKRATLRDDPLIQQLHDLRLLVAEKDMRIKELEQKNSDTKSAPNMDGPSLQEQNETIKAQLEQAQADRARFDELLHSEIRRQSRAATTQKAHRLTPQVVQEATIMLNHRLRRMSRSCDPAEESPSQSTAIGPRLDVLEQELKHCIQEIIMYKLDVRGYKKDLKAANAKLEALEAAAEGRPETPDSRTGKGSKPRPPSRQAISKEDGPSAGLGISMRQQNTPSRAPVIASTSLPPSATSSPRSQPAAVEMRPPHRPKTPLGCLKKLPRAPSQTPSPQILSASPPGPRGKLQRQETSRSLSESIISSYAKRGSPEIDMDTAPPMPIRDRRSDPPRNEEGYSKAGLGAVAVPIAKFAAELLRTPGKGKTVARM